MDKYFSKIQNKNKADQSEIVFRLFSQPKRDCLYQARKNLIKNYVLDPDAKLVI